MSRRTVVKPAFKLRRWHWYVDKARLVLARAIDHSPRELAFRSSLVCTGLSTLMVVVGTTDTHAGHQVHAFFNIWVQLAILVFSALLSYALAPKPKTPEAQKAQVPVVEEGKGIVIIFGEVWINDPIPLEFKPLKPIPIKAKGKK